VVPCSNPWYRTTWQMKRLMACWSGANAVCLVEVARIAGLLRCEIILGRPSWKIRSKVYCTNADANTAVKWKRGEQCCPVTLLTACCSCMNCRLCSLGLEMDQNRPFCLVLYSLERYAQCRHSVALICGDGVGMGTVFTGTCRDGVTQFLFPCRLI